MAEMDDTANRRRAPISASREAPVRQNDVHIAAIEERVHAIDGRLDKIERWASGADRLLTDISQRQENAAKDRGEHLAVIKGVQGKVDGIERSMSVLSGSA